MLAVPLLGCSPVSKGWEEPPPPGSVSSEFVSLSRRLSPLPDAGEAFAKKNGSYADAYEAFLAVTKEKRRFTANPLRRAQTWLNIQH